MKIQKRTWLTATAVLSLATVTFVACDKTKDNNDDNDTTVATDNYNAEKEADGILNAINSAVYDNGVMRTDEDGGIASTLLPECATVTIDTVSTPKKITIAFDSTGAGCLCSDWDGKYRKGKIVATWSGRYRDAGTVITINTENYYVNNNKHEYSKTVTNAGENASGHLTYNVSINLCKITFTDGSVFNMTSQRTREWMQGQNTLTPYDDVYDITGTASGTARGGNAFTVNITNPLEVALACKWIRKGTVVISPEGKASRTVDYGNGSCDSQATVEINGTTYNITL